MIHSAKQLVKRTLRRLCGIRDRLDNTDAVLLTFDDGPHAEVTPEVLRRLKRYDARAVFFIVGKRISNAPHVLAEIATAGHRLRNHSYSHWTDGVPGLRACLADLRWCQNMIEQHAGKPATLFRPPMGKVTAGSLAAARRMRLRSVHWSVDPHDWKLRCDRYARACGEKLAQDVGPGDIVLLHDDNRCVLTVLDVLLPELASRGVDLASGVSML